jgi:branched-chain amino acid transport system permease protein
MDFSLLLDPTYLGQNLVDGLAHGAVYSVFALGFTLIFGILDIVNLAHAATYMWCAFVGWIVLTALGWPLPLALAAAMGAGALVAVGLELVAFRPLRREGAESLAPMISSLGASLILVSIAEAVFGSATRRFPAVLDAKPLLLGGPDGIRVAWAQILIFFVSLALMAALGWFIRRTRLGMAIRAVAANRKAARLLGINVNAVVTVTFAVAGALAGAAGILVGLMTNNIFPGMGAQIELRGLAVVILGGMGSIEGAVLGGLILGLVETFTIAYLPSGADYKDAVAFLILFLILWLKPNGLFARPAGTRA